MVNEYFNEFYQPFISLKDYAGIFRIIKEKFREDINRCYNKKELIRNLAVYIINIVVSQNGKVAVSRDISWFKKNIKNEWHTVRIAKNAQDILKNKRYITLRHGYKNGGFVSGFSTILEKTPLFDEVFGTIEKSPVKVDSREVEDLMYKEEFEDETFDEHYFPAYKKTTSFKVIDKGKKYITKNDNIEHSFSRDLNFLEKTMKTMYILNNQYFNKIELGFDDNRCNNMIRNVYLTRIFTRDGSGRFFQKCGTSYQNIEKEDRKHLIINGERTVEVDYKGMHINLLYVAENTQNDFEDVYMPVVVQLIGEENIDLRKVVKDCILIAINAKNMKAYAGALNRKKPETVRILRSKGIKPKKVIEAFGTVHHLIAGHLNSDSGIWLMWQDSKIMEKVLLKLKRKKIYGIPLHDSIICPERYKNEVKEIMERTYKEVTGFRIKVEIKE